MVAARAARLRREQDEFFVGGEELDEALADGERAFDGFGEIRQRRVFGVALEVRRHRIDVVFLEALEAREIFRIAKLSIY